MKFSLVFCLRKKFESLISFYFNQFLKYIKINYQNNKLDVLRSFTWSKGWEVLGSVFLFHLWCDNFFFFFKCNIIGSQRLDFRVVKQGQWSCEIMHARDVIVDTRYPPSEWKSSFPFLGFNFYISGLWRLELCSTLYYVYCGVSCV